MEKKEQTLSKTTQCAIFFPSIINAYMGGRKGGVDVADLETLKVLADQIAVFAVTLKGSGFTVCISNGDVSDDVRKKFQETLIEAIGTNHRLVNQAKAENRNESKELPGE